MAEPIPREQYIEIRRAKTLLNDADFDADSNLIVDPACIGCEIPKSLQEIYDSGDPKYYDLSIMKAIAPTMLESVYRDCPGRAVNSVPKWRAVIRRILNAEPVNVMLIRESTAGKEPGSFTPCGLDRENPRGTKPNQS